MRIVDRCEARVPNITITDMLPQLLADIEAQPELSLAELKAALEARPEYEQLRLAAPHLWLKALRRDLRADDPFLQQMLGNIDQIRAGQKTLKKAWKEVDRSVTTEFVTKKIGAPDAQGRPTGPPPK